MELERVTTVSSSCDNIHTFKVCKLHNIFDVRFTNLQACCKSSDQSIRHLRSAIYVAQRTISTQFASSQWIHYVSMVFKCWYALYFAGFSKRSTDAMEFEVRSRGEQEGPRLSRHISRILGRFAEVSGTLSSRLHVDLASDATYY